PGLPCRLRRASVRLVFHIAWRPLGAPLFPYPTLFRSDRAFGNRQRSSRVRPGGRAPPRPSGAAPGRIWSRATTVAATRNEQVRQDRKSTRLNSSHVKTSYAVFCPKKKRRLRTAAT